MKNIEIGKSSGFCSGVNLCINSLEKEMNGDDKIYCLGDIIHNRQVVEHFKEKGLVIIDSLRNIERGSKVVVRAHGIAKEIYEQANEKGIKLIDLTCPKVFNIRNLIKDDINEETLIILIAKKNHPETISTISFCGNNSKIIEDEEDIYLNIDKMNKYKKLVIIAQTTFNEILFNKYVDIIKKNISDKINVVVKNTICNATSTRQKEVGLLSKRKECMIIIGGRNSSNTKKLYDIASINCPNTFMIETKDDLNISEINKFNDIGIMAGASTPKQIVDEVVDLLNAM